MIQSHQGEYQVKFTNDVWFDEIESETNHYIIDEKIADCYQEALSKILQSPSVLLIKATESNKALHQFPAYVEHLVKNKVRRDHRFIAIGGGIIQDITCFLAATLLRGVNWWFYPTTLLAQADSCIGSKSSINCGNTKNILGTFTPPKKITIALKFLDTLDRVDICSGVGEMLKVHAIEGIDSFNSIANDYELLFTNKLIMQKYIRRSLEIKKKIIEQDEFDRGIRNVMNYGHTFGHAIESAADYKIPHGIAVTIGMDMANYVASNFKFGSEENYLRMHPILKKNFSKFIDYDIPLETFINAISKDKKNKGNNQLGLILPDKKGVPTRTFFENDHRFKAVCKDYLLTGRTL
ncbi:MAG: 3-dehydroquinate synthase [Gammaproteobacteria bacterium RIFCSPHIGHO2_12_FULL_35_23]|nr:MAG: 3-dehydroquinate synthase [Gammaproteobacteria bacterium RIFCSPHIGHO2_12_FULL_35_23]